MGCLHGICQKTAHRHGPDPAWNRRDGACCRRGLREADVADDPRFSVVLDAVYPHVDYGRPRFDPIAANQLRATSCYYEDVGDSAVFGKFVAARVQRCNGAVMRKQEM